MKQSRTRPAAAATPSSPSQSTVSANLVPPLLDWFNRNARDLPWRRTTDPYAIWVSEIMLQQTQVRTVIPYWERWMQHLPSIRHLAAAESEMLHKLWEGLGYYTRVRNLQKAARHLMAHRDGRFPETFDEILELPGIGRYTAGAICSIAFNQPTPILDGNIVRVLTRVFGIDSPAREKKTTDHLWDLAEQLVIHAHASTRHPRACSALNQSLMELGALICTPRNPQCELCPVSKHCNARRTNRMDELPNLGPRHRPTARHFIAFVLKKNGRYLVRRRAAGEINAHLWEFPNAELLNGHENGTPARLFASMLGSTPACLQPLCSIKHSITRYRITLDAFLVAQTRATPERSSLHGKWFTLARLHSLPFTSAHRKILAWLASTAL